MAQKHTEHTEQPMTRAGTIQGPSRRYRRLRHPNFPAAEWASKNPLLQRGELGIEKDTHKMKAGDGVTYWNDLPYMYDDAGQPLSTADYQMGNASGGWTTMSQAQQDALNSGATTTNIGQIATNTNDIATNKGTMDAHIADTNNPHNVTKAQVGLGNCDNTADLDKPISTAMQNALDGKVDKNPAITSATKCKITYDNKGLVTGGTDLAESDIPALHLSKISDVTATATEINVLDGITASTAELNYVDGVTSNIQTQLDSKVEANAAITGATHTKITYDNKGLVTGGSDITLADVTDITATAAEVNVLDGITVSTAELNILDGVTASATEINVLDGITASTTELNYVDGVTSPIQTQLDNKQGLLGGGTSGTVLTNSGTAGTVTATTLATVATSGSYTDLSDKPTIGDATLTIQKNGTNVDTFTANATSNKTINITVPVTAADVGALPDSTKYVANASMTINSSTYVVTLQLKDQDGNNIGTPQTVDLPLETMVVSGSYDDATKKIVLTLQNGQTIEFSVADLVSGLQTEITANNMLNADLVDDSTSTNKFVTASDITTWNGKQDALTAGSNITISGTTISATDTTYTGSDGITLTGTNFTNSGVRSVATGSTNGTISVNTGGTSADVAVYGLGSAAYTASTDYATSAQGTKADTAVQPGDLATVATTGDYGDLLNKPTIPTVNDATLTIQKNGTTVNTFTANASTNVTANITVPTAVSDLTNDSGYITGINSSDVTTALGYTPVDPSNLATVATSGSYNDLSNKPTIPAAQVNSDWNANSGVAQILNKPTLGTAAAANTTDFATAAQGALADTAVQPVALDDKVDKVTGNYKIYGTNGSGGQTSYNMASTASANSIAYRTTGGVLNVGTPTADTHAATKKYVDDLIPTVNDATITITQGGVTKGSFTLNQASGDTIALDAGGGGSVDIDNLTITENASQQIQAVATVNQNSANGATNPVYNWVGTLAEWTSQNIATVHPDWICYITDDEIQPGNPDDYGSITDPVQSL